MIQKLEVVSVTWYSAVVKWKLSAPCLVVLTETTTDGKRSQIHYRGRKRYTKVIGLSPNTKYTFSLSVVAEKEVENGVVPRVDTSENQDTTSISNHGKRESGKDNILWNVEKLGRIVDRRDVHFKTLKCGEHDVRLIAAIQNHQLKEVEEICKKSPESVNIADKTGLSAIMHASQRGFPSIIRILQESGGSLDYANPSGKTALMLAAYQGNSHVISTLMNLGCDWTMRDKAGCTALHYSIERGDMTICEDLIKHGADVNLADSRGYTGLMSLCLSDREQVDMSRFLLEQGASAKQVLPSGETLVMCAARTNKPDIVALLLGFGADPLVKTRYGFSALDMCSEDGPCYEILAEYFPSDSDSD